MLWPLPPCVVGALGSHGQLEIEGLAPIWILCIYFGHAEMRSWFLVPLLQLLELRLLAMPLDEFGVVVDAPNFFLRGRCCLLSAVGCGEFGVAVKTL